MTKFAYISSLELVFTNMHFESHEVFLIGRLEIDNKKKKLKKRIYSYMFFV